MTARSRSPCSARSRWRQLLDRRCAVTRVGCVLLAADGSVIAEGFHRGAGTPHAEVAALRSATRNGPLPDGVTAVVTLEPCNHTGRTGPCAQALIEAGIAKVVYGQGDPNPIALGVPSRCEQRVSGPTAVTARSKPNSSTGSGRLQSAAADRTCCGSTQPRWTVEAPPPTAPVAGSPAQLLAVTCTRCEPFTTRSWPEPARFWSTTRR